MPFEQLKQQAYALVGQQLPNDTFARFDYELTTRMLVAVTCMKVGYKELAYQIFSSIAEQGPQENANQHFAYVRSLVEMAEMDAEHGEFASAENKMAEAIDQYPPSMGYMMSRIHLEIYLIYYRFQNGKTDQAYHEIQELVQREIDHFESLPEKDAVSLVSPGLCYAIHQWSLFYAQENKWMEACQIISRMTPYATKIDESSLNQAEELLQLEKEKEAYDFYQKSYDYQAN